MVGSRGNWGRRVLSHQPNNLIMSSDRGLVTVFLSIRFASLLSLAQPANLMSFI